MSVQYRTTGSWYTRCMKEVEVKARVGNLEELLDALTAQGIILGEPLLQEDVIYVRELGSLDTFLANGLFLRLRTLGSGKVLFTAKYNPNRNAEQDMVAEEYETEIASREAMERIVALLGFSEAVRVRKNRRSAQSGVYEFCVDEVEGLGTFIEVERMVDETVEVQVIHDELLGVLSSLGIPPEDRFTKRYDVMVLEQSLRS